MRVVFMGTGEIAIPSFRGLVAAGHELAALVTQPDRPVGRHQELRPPAIKEWAQDHQIPVLQPERLRSETAVAEVAAASPDLIVVMAYGQILPPEVLGIPSTGCINIHASLLPRHRGAACLQAAIDAGDPESGVTIMHMAEGLDTGDVILQEVLPLAADDTAGDLHDRMAVRSPAVLLKAVELLGEGRATRWPQDESLATYAPKLTRREGEIDWSWTAVRLERRIRAFAPWPGTFTWLTGSRNRPVRLKLFPGTVPVPESGPPGTVLRAEAGEILVACGEGALRLGELQLDGGRRLGSRDFLAGHGLSPGTPLFSLENPSK